MPFIVLWIIGEKMDKTRIEIVESDKNPSEADLINAFARAIDDYFFILDFQTEVGEIFVIIIGLEHECGYSGRFMLKGFRSKEESEEEVEYLESRRNEGLPINVTGFYNSVEKTGYLDVYEGGEEPLDLEVPPDMEE